MDTRRYRSPLMDPDLASRTLLGSEQLSALYSWLNMVTTTTLIRSSFSEVLRTSR